MYLKSCCTLLLLALVACQAAPSPKIIETETNKELTIEETGEERDRAKKAATTFCVQINSDGKEEAVSCDSQKFSPNTPIHIVQVPQLVLPSQPAPLPVPLPLPAPAPVPLPAPLPAPVPAPVPVPSPTPKPAPLPSPTTPAPKPAPPASKPAPQPIPVLPSRIEVQPPASQAPSASPSVINILPSAPCPSVKPQLFGKEKYALVPPTLGKLSSFPRKLPVLYRVATQPELVDTSVYPFYPLDESAIEITKTAPLEASDLECGCARLNQAGYEGGAYRVSPIAHFNPNIVRREVTSPIVAAESKRNHKHPHHHHRHKKTEISEDTSVENPHENEEEFRNHTSSNPTQIVFLQFPLTNQPATYPSAYQADFSQYATDLPTYPIFSYPNTYQATTYIKPVYHNQNLDELVGQSNWSEEESEKANPIIKEELREEDDTITHSN